jgi:hypothetical protein
MPPATHPAANLKASLNLQHVGLGLCGLGLLLMITSVFWPRMTKTDAVWTDGQAREYAGAAGTYHQLAFEHGAKGEDPARGEPGEVTAARNAYKLLRETACG